MLAQRQLKTLSSMLGIEPGTEEYGKFVGAYAS